MNSLTQTYSSKNISVNTTKLPYIYTHLDWEAMKKTWYNGRIKVFDYGCGKEVNHIVDFLTSKGIDFEGYDPNWGPKLFIINDREMFFDDIRRCELRRVMPIIICSNVLNTIHPWQVQHQIHRDILDTVSPYFLKLYEGNKSGIGEESKKDCFQWNKDTEDYVIHYTEVIKKKILTHSLYARFIK